MVLASAESVGPNVVTQVTGGAGGTKTGTGTVGAAGSVGSVITLGPTTI